MTARELDSVTGWHLCRFRWERMGFDGVGRGDDAGVDLLGRWGLELRQRVGPDGWVLFGILE